MNAILPRVIIAPITSKAQPLGCRPVVPFKGKQARILVDQLRTVDARRLTKKIGVIEPALWHEPYGTRCCSRCSAEDAGSRRAGGGSSGRRRGPGTVRTG
jgi:hypothetical protein